MKKYIESAYDEDEYRDIDWGIEFDITIDGEDARWEDLTDSEQEIILNQISEGYYGGTF